MQDHLWLYQSESGDLIVIEITDKSRWFAHNAAPSVGITVQ